MYFGGKNTNLNEEVIRALGHAYFCALNRKATEIGVEDLFVGLCSALGDTALVYFEDPQKAKTSAEMISQRHGNRFDVFHFPASAQKGPIETDSEGREVAYAGPFLFPGSEVNEIMETAQQSAESQSGRKVNLNDVMTAFAKCQSTLLEQNYGVFFKES
jgi:hypothetical protein